jgi:hypothetical protein
MGMETGVRLLLFKTLVFFKYNDENSRIRSGIYTKMSWIRNTGSNSSTLFGTRTRKGERNL